MGEAFFERGGGKLHDWDGWMLEQIMEEDA